MQTATGAASIEREAKAIGVVANEQVAELATLLRALCHCYGSIKLHEVVMRAPLQLGTSSMLLRLARSVEVDNTLKQLSELPPERWSTTMEGANMRGAQVRDLPAALREVREAVCFGQSTPTFWQALGAKPQYELTREGNEYFCLHDGFNIKVHLVRLGIITQAGNPRSAQNRTPYVLEASCRAQEGQHIQAAVAIGSFANRLVPLVQLQRAEVEEADLGSTAS